MSFLAQADCVPHGVIAQNGICCDGLTAWGYDANAGVPYGGFGCWNATCAQEGQFAPPGGISGGGQCCTGLVDVGGKCSKPPGGGTVGCATVGKAPLIGQACCSGLSKDAQGLCNTPQQQGNGEIISGIPNDWLMYGGIALVALLMLGGKKR